MIGLTLAFSPSPPQFSNGGVDAAIDAAVKPIADVVSSVIFFSIQVGDTPVQLVVVWLMVAATCRISVTPRSLSCSPVKAEIDIGVV